jgi:MFS family permease
MRWRMLGWICLAELGALSLWFSATAVVPALHTAWMSTAAQAWLSMAVTLGFVVGTVASAVLTLTDFVGARRLFVLTAVGGALVNLALLGVIESLPLVLACRFLTGLAMAGTYPPAMKLAASWFVTDRGLAVGSLVGALTLGGAVPHLINVAGGLVWWPAIAGTSGAALAAAVVMATLVRDGPHVQARAPFNPRCIQELVRSRAVVLASLGYFGHMWELYAMWTWIGLYLLEAFTRAGLPGAASVGSMATAIVIGVGAVSCVLAGYAADRIGRTAVTMLAMAGSGACAAVIGFTFDRPGWLVLVALVWGFTVVADSAQFSASITELAPPAYVGTALSLQTSLGFLLTLASTWLVPRAVEAWGWPWAFAFLAPGPVLGTLAMAGLRRLPESARLAQGRR